MKHGEDRRNRWGSHLSKVGYQGMGPDAVIIDWKAAMKAAKPFDDTAKRRSVLESEIKDLRQKGYRLMHDQRVLKYLANKAAITHNFLEFARVEKDLGHDLFHVWLNEHPDKLSIYHQLFQANKAISTPLFDIERSMIDKATALYAAARNAQVELDTLLEPKGGGQ
jgi:hypothetical protein